MSESAKSFREALIRSREQRGITDVRAAAILGLSIEEYFDLEAYDDEWMMVVPASAIASAISFFEIDWRGVWTGPTIGSVEPTYPLNDFFRALRDRLGLTRSEFADRVGFNEGFADVIEGHACGLALWPVAVAVLTAQASDIRTLALTEWVLQPQAALARIILARQSRGR